MHIIRAEIGREATSDADIKQIQERLEEFMNYLMNHTEEGKSIIKNIDRKLRNLLVKGASAEDDK